MKTIVVGAFLTVFFGFSSSQVIKLACRESAAPNPFTCPQQQTCDDQECSAQNKICCAISTPGQCGFSCQVGEYLGCFETSWWCYGPQIIENAILPKRYSGPAYFIDNQDGVLNVGHAAQIEYIATRAGVPVTFMLLASADGTEHKFRETTYQITHTAATVGKHVVKVDWNIQRHGLRLAYKTEASGEFPIPFDNNKPGSTEAYHSFIDPEVDGEMVTVQSSQRVPGGINMRFQARICLNAEAGRVDDAICGYEPPVSTTESITTTSSTTATTSDTTSSTTATTSDEGPDPICEYKPVPRHIGCIGQAAPQYPSHFTQTATGGSYSNIDMTGELRDGNITSIEYHVVRIAPIVFQVWEEENIPSSSFILRHQMVINPTATNQIVSIDLAAMDKQMEVKERWRYGFTYITVNGNPVVPLQYRVVNVHDELVDTGRPYVSAECQNTGCGVTVGLGQRVQFTNRNNLVQQQFNIRPCMTTYEYVEVCEEE